MSNVTDNMGIVEKWALGVVNRWVKKQTVEKTRQQIPEFALDPSAKVRLPTYKEGELLELSKNHWLLRTIIRTRTDEIINPNWEIKARYRKKCTSCGKEYQDIDVEECDNPGCGSKEFDEPDIEQYKKLQAFIKNPSPDRTMEKFIRSTFHYGFSLDKYMWEIAQTKKYDPATGKYSKTSSNTPNVRILDASTILPNVNAYGDYGNYEWFCPVCYMEQYMQDKMDHVVDIREYIDRGTPIPSCKYCGGELKPTAYVQEINGKVVARWTKDEIVSESPQSIDPHVDGLSSIVPAIKHLYIIDYMDSYNLQIYTQGDVGSLIIFPDTDSTEVKELQQDLENELKKRVYRDVITGKAEPGLQIMTGMVGVKSGKEPKRLQLMETLSNLQSLDFYVLYVEKVCGLFGVIPVFSAQKSQGDKSSSLSVSLNVPNSVTRASMTNFEESFNNKLLPKIGITDWLFTFGKVESKDMMRDAQIKQTNMMAISLAVDKGFDVEVQPDLMNYTVSSEPTHEPPVADTSSRLTEGKIPQSKDGAPNRTMPGGAGSGVPVIEPEKREE